MSDNEMDLDASGDSVVSHDMNYNILNSHFDDSQAPEEVLDLTRHLHVVSAKLPQVSWKTVADAMAACAQSMPRNSKNEEVIKFVQDCMYQILYVMISLNAIDGNPRTLTELQNLWKDETFDEFNRCFHVGLSDAMRTMVRIGDVCPVAELKGWNDWEYNKHRRSTWVNSLEVLLDCEQSAFRQLNANLHVAPEPNSLWDACLATFFAEEGFYVLYRLLDPEAFVDLPADKVVDREHVLHCKVARLLKRLVTRHHIVVGERHMPNSAEVALAMEAVNTISKGALEWLKGRLNTSPDKLTQLGKSKDTELIDTLTELIGPEQSLGLARGLLSMTSLGSQQAGLRLARELRKQGGEMSAALNTLPHEFLETLKSRLNASGDDLVKQLMSMKVLAKRSIVDTFEELAMLMETDEEKFTVCMFWGDVGLRCMCTAEERTREIGIGLLESLTTSQPHFPAQDLAEPARKSLMWIKGVCGSVSTDESTVKEEGKEFNLAKSLEVHGLKECERLGNFFITLHHILLTTGCVDEAESIAGLWMDTAVLCLRALDKYPVREMGLQLVQEAIRLNNNNYSVNEKYGGAAAHRGKLGRALVGLVALEDGVKAVLDSLLSEKYAHHAVIRLASTWLVEVYYREYCYEDEVVDLMKYLVDAAVHPEWGVMEPVTDLLVRVTVTNISIKSLNSLCNLFKEAVNNKATAAAANTLILAWIDKTRQKKWVIGVQERVLNLLWTMLVNNSSENEDDTVKVLDYFKNQFSNIRGHASSDWGPGERSLSEKELTARHCILTCATDCLAEIKRCGDGSKSPKAANKTGPKSEKAEAIAEALTAEPSGFPPLVRSPSTYEPEELRGRASQSASLLNIVLNLVDNLRPDVLREMHGEESPTSMVEGLLQEALSSATFLDVEPSAILVRLRLISNISSYLIDSSPLTLKMVKSIWEAIFHSPTSKNTQRHREVCLRWLHTVLRPKELAGDMLFFKGRDAKSPKKGAVDEAVEARKFVLEQLGTLVVGTSDEGIVNLSTFGSSGVDCLLSLFIWVNKDSGALEETDKTSQTTIYPTYSTITASHSKLSTTSSSHIANAVLPLYADVEDDEVEDVTICGDEIQSFDALTTAALDSDPSQQDVVFPACRTLLRVSSACFKARRNPVERVEPTTSAWGMLSGSSSKAKPAPSTLGLERYDLLVSIFTRIESLQETASARSRPTVYSDIEVAKLNHWLAVLHHFFEETSIFNAGPPHGARSLDDDMVLSVVLEVEVPASTPRGGATTAATTMTESDPCSLVVNENTTLSEATKAAMELLLEKSSHGSNYVLRRYSTTLLGDFRTLKNLGVISGDKLVLGLENSPSIPPGSLPSPGEQLGASDKFVNILFGLLNNTNICDRAWGILQMIPSATSALSAITDPSQSNWSNLIGTTDSSCGLWHRIYSCQLVEAKLLPASKLEYSQVADWRRSFLTAGGLKAVLSMLDGEDLTTMSSPLRKATLGPLLRVVNLCVCSSLAQNPNAPPPTPSDVQDTSTNVLRRFSADSSDLVKNSVDLKQVMDLLFGVIRVGNSSGNLSASEVDAVSNSMATVTAMMRRSDGDVWNKVSASFPLDVLLRLLLDSPVQRLRKEAAVTFQELLSGEKDYTLYSESNKTAPLPAPEVLGPLFLGERISNLLFDCRTASEFFSVCHTLLDVSGSWLNPHEVRLTLEAKMKTFASLPPRVDEADGSDSVLVGVLAALSRLHLLDPPAPQEAEALVDLLFDTFLMRLPENARTSEQSDLPKINQARAWESGPICGTIASRESACKVLEACSVNDELKLRVLKRLAEFAKSTRPPAPEAAFLSSRAADEIKELERPGLNNTANRCYMNSLCQQLTALSGFSSCLLTAPVPVSVLEADAAEAKEKEEAGDAVVSEPTEGTWDCPVCTFQNDVAAQECCVCESPKPANVKIVAAGVDPEVERKEVESKAKAHKYILRELQRTIRFLKSGEMRCFDAEPLLETVGKHLSLQFPAEQQNDTKEFMDKLLDRLEIELGDTVAKDLVKENFGATTAETKVRQHDGKLVNRNTTTMTTYTLQLQVEGVGSLDEAIETNLAPNIREVDDDDEVDANGKPVKHKFEYRMLFVDLPEVLCVQLSRFSFDYGRGVPIKHNHRVEFPMELNMGKYTESGLDVGPESPNSTFYRLRGCLVHLGPSANQGHYYSIIRSSVDPDIFLKFNDNHVSFADSIEDECFGGERAASATSSKYSNEKNWNAYLLFYERVRNDSVVTLSKNLSSMTVEKTGVEIREAQKTEVMSANADLWRRKLLYQRPVLNMTRKVLVQSLSDPQVANVDEFSQAGLTLFGQGVLHCGELSSDQNELKLWVDSLGPVMNPDSAASFLAAVAAGEAQNADDPEASKQLSVAVEASLAKLSPSIAAWTSIPLLSRSILQVGSRVSSPGVRDATAKLIAHAANKSNDMISLEALLSRLLAAIAQLYSERELLEGFVTLIHELSKFDTLHEFLHRLDLPAILVHIYLNQSSPISGWVETEGLCVAGGITIPKLGANTRRGSSTHYSQTLHDFKRLHRALACLLRNEKIELTPLSARALIDRSLITRIVEREPIAGVEPALPKVRTLEEENAALAEEGWRHHTGTGKGYWVREGYKNSYTSDRPTPRGQSVVELEDEGLLIAQPRDLLLVTLALRGTDMQEMVLEALLEGVESGLANNWLTERRSDALSMLLKCNEDGLRESRIKAAHDSLFNRIENLRTGATPALQALKNLAQCTRMELLTSAIRRVRVEGGDVLGDIAPDDDLLWVPQWLEQRKPQLRVTLKDLQGSWTNNQMQGIYVVKDRCSFANSEPVTITQEPDTGTFCVPGWTLVQEDSYPGNVLWASKVSRDTTRWTRVQTTHVIDDDDDELYGDGVNAHTL